MPEEDPHERNRDAVHAGSVHPGSGGRRLHHPGLGGRQRHVAAGAHDDTPPRDGTRTLPGAPAEPGVFSLLFRRRRLSGSVIGGIRETQEMLDFCAGHGIPAEIELIPVRRINVACERLPRGDVRCRCVIDESSSE